MLLLPMGALSIELFRQLVAVRIYGKFSPTLLVVTAVFVDWVTAKILLGLVTVFGVGGIHPIAIHRE